MAYPQIERATNPIEEREQPAPILSPARGSRRGMSRTALTLTPFLVLLLLWIWLFYAEGAFAGGPNGKSFEADFAMFVGAAQVLHDGANPYDQNVLYATERHLLVSQGLPPRLAPKSIVRVGNPPVFFWLLEPLARFPFQTVGIAWMVFLYALSAIGFYALLAYMRWSRKLLPLLIFLLMPQVLFGPFYGNVVTVVFCAVALSLALVRRYPYAAGLLLVFAWLKPQVAMPTILLMGLFLTANWQRLGAGFATSTVLLFALTLLATGPASLRQWLAGLVNYSNDIAASPDLTSLSGLYVRVTASPVRVYCETAVIAGALVLTALAWHQYRREGSVQPQEVAWLSVMWFLATPYAHFFDEILLALPVLAILGRNGVHTTAWQGLTTLYLALVSLLLISAAPGGVQLLFLPLAGIAICAFFAQRKSPRAVAA
ncbi:MAG: hypothetical protein NVSMB52_15450 [Chloroflexota bacterium]